MQVRVIGLLGIILAYTVGWRLVFPAWGPETPEGRCMLALGVVLTLGCWYRVGKLDGIL